MKIFQEFLTVSHQIFSRYYSITSGGASTLSFNATSVQNMVILGLLLLVLGALILPMFGIEIFADEVNIHQMTELSGNHSFLFRRPEPLLTAVMTMARFMLTLPRELGWIS